MHAGPQQILFSIRGKFWVVSGRNFVNAVVDQCVRCYKFKAKPIQPKMGDLPKERLTFRVGKRPFN